MRITPRGGRWVNIRRWPRSVFGPYCDSMMNGLGTVCTCDSASATFWASAVSRAPRIGGTLARVNWLADVTGVL